MTTIYTQLFAREALSNAQDHLLYVAPNERTSIIRDIVIVNTAAVELLVNLYVQSGIANFTIWYEKIPPQSTSHVDLRQELTPGEGLRGFCPSDGLVVHVTGYSLSGT